MVQCPFAYQNPCKIQLDNVSNILGACVNSRKTSCTNTIALVGRKCEKKKRRDCHEGGGMR